MGRRPIRFGPRARSEAHKLPSKRRPAPAPTPNPKPRNQGEVAMAVIPFNVPGLPEIDELSGEFVVRPVSIDPGGSDAGPTLGLHFDGTAAATGSPLTDGVLCIYPGTDMISYLFDIQVRSGQKDLLPGLLVYSASVGGSVSLFSMTYDLNSNPVLVVTILPDEYLPKILTTYEGETIADVSGVDDRLEFTQVFTANSFGAVKRISNDLTHVPKERGAAVFDLSKDLDTISDVASFYMTRTLMLTGGEPHAPGAEGVPTVGNGVWALLWKPVTWAAVAAFSWVYVLTRTSVSYRSLNGNVRIDYNLPPNRPPNQGQGQGQGQGQQGN